MTRDLCRTKGKPKADWDPLDEATLTDPFLEYARLRERCPVPHSDRYGGFWMLTRYEDVAKAARDHTSFPSSDRILVQQPPVSLVPITMNPPDHTRYRRLLNKYFSPARMEALEPILRRYVIELLEPLVEAGRGEMVADFCLLLPIRAFCAAFNVPEERWDEVLAFQEEARAMSDRLIFGSVDGFEDEEVVPAALIEMSRALVELRRREPLGVEEDMASGLLAAGESEEMAVEIITMMFVAGHDTTKSALSSSLYALATDQELQARLRREPQLIPQAVEEILRLRPPLHHLARTPAEDAEIAGARIPAGEPVALNYASANRDEAAFPEAGRCMIDRQPNRHLTFGHGVHKCIGAPLARLELRLTLEELLSRTEALAPDGDFELMEVPFETGAVRLPMRMTKQGSRNGAEGEDPF